MKRFTGLLSFVLGISLMLLAVEVEAQDRALQQLIQGKKLFWDAKFEQSMQSLRQVVGVPDAKQEYLFEAYLYMGFVLMRQNAASSDINNAFEQAVKVDPDREIDENIIPPDLVERFKAVRNRMAGDACVYVMAEPEAVNMTVVQDDSVVFSAETPAKFCRPAIGDYKLLLTKPGYEEILLPLHFTSSETDTVSYTLKPSSSVSSSGGGSGGRSVWGWVARGGIVVAAGAVLYKTVLEGKDSGGDELPGPPPRPDTQ